MKTMIKIIKTVVLLLVCLSLLATIITRLYFGGYKSSQVRRSVKVNARIT